MIMQASITVIEKCSRTRAEWDIQRGNIVMMFRYLSLTATFSQIRWCATALISVILDLTAEWIAVEMNSRNSR